jgi:hypothetical protein
MEAVLPFLFPLESLESMCLMTHMLSSYQRGDSQ